MSERPIGEILWGKAKHEANSLRALLSTIEHLDADECAVTITEADDPTPFPLSIPTLQLLVAEYRTCQCCGLQSQLQSLLETLESGDVETACIWLRAAIKRLEK